MSPFLKCPKGSEYLLFGLFGLFKLQNLKLYFGQRFKDLKRRKKFKLRIYKNSIHVLRRMERFNSSVAEAEVKEFLIIHKYHMDQIRSRGLLIIGFSRLECVSEQPFSSNRLIIYGEEAKSEIVSDSICAIHSHSSSSSSNCFEFTWICHIVFDFPH